MALSTLFEVYFGGATPGKRMPRLTVPADGTPVELPASLTRNLLRAVDSPSSTASAWLRWC
jgi:uncharacterized RDD family membrane protein YckC